MNKIANFAFALVTLLLAACERWIGIGGNGHIVTEQRTIADFAEITASGGVTVDWHGGAPALSITTDENLFRYIDNNISGQTLRVHTRNMLRPSHGIKVAVSSAQLRGADLSGAVDLIARGVSGPKFYVRAHGASDLKIDGNVDEFLGDLTGASDLKAEKLQTRTTEISSSGASSVKISVSETLRVSITGASDVIYFGNPKTIEKHISGAGSIRHKE